MRSKIGLMLDHCYEDIEIFKFSGGEISVKIKNIEKVEKARDIKISVALKDSDGIMATCLLKNAIDNIMLNKDVELIMSYIPYGRQDRVCNEGEAFSLKVFTNIINSLNFSKVITLDPHSDVSTALINNCVAVPISQGVFLAMTFFKDFEDVLERCTIVSPDAGAEKKIQKFCKDFGKSDYVRAGKVRDTLTGNIVRTEVYADSLEGEFLIMVVVEPSLNLPKC